ncbi:MAG: DUF3419 family protein [Bacteroidales bacterium]|nr:DUF3419 family protein [Bacteroidales bacterium]
MSVKIKYPIRYSQCWEDIELLLEALDIKLKDTVLSIASGGCNTLSVLSRTHAKVFVIDQNPYQLYLFELKYVALVHLSEAEAKNFFGIEHFTSRMDLYKRIRDHLGMQTREFWNSHPQLIQKGIIHSGKFEHYLRLFRRIVLPLVHRSDTINYLLNITDKVEQVNFYKNIWNNIRWRFLFKVFFGKTVMRKYGRSKKMFRYNTRVNIGTIYYLRTEKALMKGNLSKNRYLEYILTGKYKKNKPYYFGSKALSGIRKANLPMLSCKNLYEFLTEQPDNSIDKFNLSDVFEAMSLSICELVFKQILRVGRKNARIIFWNNLVHRDVPQKLKPYYKPETELADKLSQRDNLFFYANFKIYTLVK